MGLKVEYLQFIESSIDRVFSNNTNLKMLELGDQVIMNNPSTASKTGKEYFVNLGFEHTSVDINGMHGALIKNLTKQEEFDQWKNYFDIVTNSGTTEHIEPYESQYTCFNILHQCSKVGGLMIHLIPDKNCFEKYGAWSGHCNYYYSHDFFQTLADQCGYEILSSEVIDQLICVCLIKTKDIEFVIDKSLFLNNIYNNNQKETQ